MNIRTKNIVINGISLMIVLTTEPNLSESLPIKIPAKTEIILNLIMENVIAKLSEYPNTSVKYGAK